MTHLPELLEIKWQSARTGPSVSTNRIYECFSTSAHHGVKEQRKLECKAGVHGFRGDDVPAVVTRRKCFEK
mgnify:CR=1 FL=1|jgi:hypothetical protein